MRNKNGRNGKADPKPHGAPTKILGPRLHAWRMEKGLPLKHLARELGVSISIVSEWEHAHRFPSVTNLEAIARLLETHVCCLLYHGPGRCPHAKPFQE